MLATHAEGDLSAHSPPRSRAEELAAGGCGGESDGLAPARGILLGALLGSASLGMLASLGWWLL